MCSLATCYKGKRLCLHSLHFQQLPSFQLPWSIQIKLQIKTIFLEWGPQGVACHSNAISVITCSELGRESQILNMWSCPFNPSQCPRNASISEPTSPTQKKKKKNHAQKSLRWFWFGKCVLFSLTQAQRQFSNLALISSPSLSLHHLSQAFISWASSRPSLVSSGDNSAFCYVEKTYCQVRGWRSSAQRSELATERNVLLFLTLRFPEREFPSSHALHQGYKPL